MGKSDKLDPDKIGMAPNMRLTWTTNNRFATCSRRSLESRQGQCKTDWYPMVYMQDAQAGVFCLSRMQSQCLSQEFKKVRHVSYQAETHVSPIWKRWDTCLTKLKKGDRDTGNIAIKDIIIILKLANQFGWSPCTPLIFNRKTLP